MARLLDDDWGNVGMLDPMETLQDAAEKALRDPYSLWDDPDDVYEDDALPYIDEFDL